MSEQQPVISQALALVVESLKQQQILPIDWVDNSTISRTKDQAHGDFASNLAMIAAKTAKKNPREPVSYTHLTLPTT
jgi:arginyl-tRNA synthetase